MNTALQGTRVFLIKSGRDRWCRRGAFWSCKKWWYSSANGRTIQLPTIRRWIYTNRLCLLTSRSLNQREKCGRESERESNEFLRGSRPFPINPEHLLQTFGVSLRKRETDILSPYCCEVLSFGRGAAYFSNLRDFSRVRKRIGGRERD